MEFATGENKPTFQSVSEFKNAKLEVERALQVWNEAYERLEAIGDFDELLLFTCNSQNVQVVEDFLKENRQRLSEEGKFFLEMTINLRRAKKKYREVAGLT